MSTRARAPIRIAVGMFGLLVAGIVAGELSGWPFLRQPMQNAASRGAAVPVELDGRVRVHLLWRPRLEVEHLRIASDPRFDVPHLLDARGVSLAWGWNDIWRWQRSGAPLRVQTLQADTLDAHLQRTPDGHANWQLGAPDQTPREDEQGLGGIPRFGSLVVGQGQIDWKDAVQDIDLDIRVRGREGDAVGSADAGYDASFTGRYQALKMQLQARTGGALPLLHDPETAPDAPWVPVRVEGSVASSNLLFDGQAAALLGTPRLDGALSFRGPSLAAVGEPLGITLPQTPPFHLRGRLSQDSGVWRLQASRANIGTSRLAGDLSFHQRATPRRLSGTLSGPKLAFADLGPAVGGDAPQAKPASSSADDGRVLPQRRFDLPSLKVMDADVKVDVDQVDFGTTAMAPLQDLKMRVLLQAGVLRLEDLRTTVAGGRFEGMTQLDANAQPAKWQARLNVTGVDIAGWLRGLRPDGAPGAAPAATAPKALKKEREQARQGGEQAVQAYVTGVVSGKFDVRGAGNSTAQILGSLDGPVDITLRDGTISHLVTEALGLDLAQALGVFIRGDNPLPLRCARFDLVANDGLVTPRIAVLDNRDSTVRASGQVNLKDESMALRVVTQPKDWSPLSLRTPINVAGTLGKPDVGIEARGLVARALGAVALGAAAGPAAAVVPLVELGKKDDGADPCLTPAPAAAPAPANGKKP
ncbi:AsmA family protein [Hydrogenophaga sp. BPS33]|uniref:AsmA family protein n=1 Tax=Hydrogenophaga sp. BPS33 TaxID=2651974 RepID=UPI00131FE68A|nr:AsmA family protein [Hydrogenophaga sp. BPS33]QHE85655.1 AsmA family protein [Hydrogenophaga sp. BPS33]